MQMLGQRLFTFVRFSSSCHWNDS